jgi:hypothetical protein
MSTSTLIIVIVVAALVVIAVVAFVGALVARHRREAALRDQFGPEYDRTVRDAGGAKQADGALQARIEARNQIDVRPLSPARQDRYRQQWRAVQAEFVDAPQASLAGADALVTSAMSDCGYPMRDFDEQADLLSVDHPEVVNDYRQAHGVFLADAAQRVSVEEARRAFIAYRSLFAELLGDDTRRSDATVASTAQNNSVPTSNKGDNRV